jgi:cytochrome c oxidase subunit III
MAKTAENHQKHPYHLVDPSPWPFVTSLSLLLVAIGIVLSMHKVVAPWILAPGTGLLLFAAFGWWRDVVKESNQGFHTKKVQIGLRLGMAFFITSEVMLFFAFFWAYFHAAFDPVEATGGMWPPKGIKTLDPFHLPYLNTLILLLSGTTLTWAHHALLEGNKKELVQGLLITVLLGAIFSCVQGFEYLHATFKMKDGIYPSTFYMATGLHGIHVIVGSIFLAVCLFRASKDEFTPKDHVGFEAAAWYWHFVDVVWLFLFISIYWMGSGPISD